MVREGFRGSGSVALAVNRCVCHEITFRELRDLAERFGLDLDGLSERTGCCTGCGLCRPYVEAMLRTGVTDFDVLGEGGEEPRPAQ